MLSARTDEKNKQPKASSYHARYFALLFIATIVVHSLGTERQWFTHGGHAPNRPTSSGGHNSYRHISFDVEYEPLEGDYLSAEVEDNESYEFPSMHEFREYASIDTSWETLDENNKIHKNDNGKFFVYQPSGGWGNQKIILDTAIFLANIMNRTLVIPPIAPHHNLYQAYIKFTANEMTPVSQLLDLELLSKGPNFGFKIWNGTLQELEEFWSHKTWIHYAKARYIGGNPDFSRPTSDMKGKHVRDIMGVNRVRDSWGPNSSSADADVVFWTKHGMWRCCVFPYDYASQISFNNQLKAVARILASSIDKDFQYNALHVRLRHLSSDRKNARAYYKAHMSQLDKNMTIYIATDAEDKHWFVPFITKYGFREIIFMEDIYARNNNRELIQRELKMFPDTMKGDVLGFLEQMICAFAVDFRGSQGSTFSRAIEVFRKHESLTKINV